MGAILIAVIAIALVQTLPTNGNAGAGNQQVRQVRVDADRPVFEVEITTGARVTKKVTFSNATRRVRTVTRVAQTDRVIVVGDGSAAKVVTILDGGSGAVADSFFVLNASVSPTGRWIAYQHFRRNGDPESGAVYAIYDTHRPAAANRPATQPGATVGVGTPVFPETSRVGRHWDGMTGGFEHVSMSPIFWTSPDVFAMVDRCGFEAKLITVRLSAGAGFEIKEAAFDLASLVNTAQLPAGENGSRFLFAESVTPVAGTADAFVVEFRPMPELKVLSTRLTVW